VWDGLVDFGSITSDVDFFLAEQLFSNNSAMGSGDMLVSLDGLTYSTYIALTSSRGIGSESHTVRVPVRSPLAASLVSWRCCRESSIGFVEPHVFHDRTIVCREDQCVAQNGKSTPTKGPKNIAESRERC
jgi:hypothetical protein